jgi:serine/threonine-protein kinase
MNQTYLPDGGCLNLKRGEDSAEPDCLDLHFVDHPVCIVKPRILFFQSFNKAYAWAYFRLETKELEPSGWYENLTGIKEELTEISPGDYADRKYWDLGSYEYDETGREIPLSSRARIVIRYFSGSFVIFAKGSAYHEISSSSAGSHSKMNEEAFKAYIGGTVKMLRKEGQI